MFNILWLYRGKCENLSSLLLRPYIKYAYDSAKLIFAKVSKVAQGPLVFLSAVAREEEHTSRIKMNR